MRRLYLSALAAIVGLFAVPTMAQNLQHCAPHDQVVARLADKYGESRQAVGLGSNNTVMEVFANIEGGSWTITVTMANGMTCLIASGQAYEALAEALPPKGDAL